jgi:hypothetical protein
LNVLTLEFFVRTFQTQRKALINNKPVLGAGTGSAITITFETPDRRAIAVE